MFPIILFVLVLDIYFVFWVGARIGVLNTFALLFMTAFVGVQMGRQIGASQIRKFAERMNSGTFTPKQSLGEDWLEGIAAMFATVLLVIPGYITDVLGLSLLFPWTRGWLRLFVKSGQMNPLQGFSSASPPEPRESAPGTIDGDYTVLEDDPSSEEGLMTKIGGVGYPTVKTRTPRAERFGLIRCLAVSLIRPTKDRRSDDARRICQFGDSHALRLGTRFEI